MKPITCLYQLAHRAALVARHVVLIIMDHYLVWFWLTPLVAVVTGVALGRVGEYFGSWSLSDGSLAGMLVTTSVGWGWTALGVGVRLLSGDHRR